MNYVIIRLKIVMIDIIRISVILKKPVSKNVLKSEIEKNLEFI